MSDFNTTAESNFEKAQRLFNELTPQHRALFELMTASNPSSQTRSENRKRPAPSTEKRTIQIDHEAKQKAFWITQQRKWMSDRKTHVERELYDLKKERDERCAYARRMEETPIPTKTGEIVTCNLCAGKHFSSQCFNYVTFQERRKRCLDTNLCEKCSYSTSSHYAECGPFVCRHCNKSDHCSLMCDRIDICEAELADLKEKIRHLSEKSGK